MSKSVKKNTHAPFTARRTACSASLVSPFVASPLLRHQPCYRKVSGIASAFFAFREIFFGGRFCPGIAPPQADEASCPPAAAPGFFRGRLGPLGFLVAAHHARNESSRATISA